jgi:hypothetical protein
MVTLSLDNDITLDFIDVPSVDEEHHDAFLVDDAEFDAIFARIRAAGTGYEHALR